MKARLTINFFLMIVFFFVLVMAGCKPAEMIGDENDSTSDPAPIGVEDDGPEAVKVSDELGVQTGEEKGLKQYQRTAKVGAGAAVHSRKTRKCFPRGWKKCGINLPWQFPWMC